MTAKKKTSSAPRPAAKKSYLVLQSFSGEGVTGRPKQTLSLTAKVAKSLLKAGFIKPAETSETLEVAAKNARDAERAAVQAQADARVRAEKAEAENGRLRSDLDDAERLIGELKAEIKSLNANPERKTPEPANAPSLLGSDGEAEE